jgi:hypothetical protein
MSLPVPKLPAVTSPSGPILADVDAFSRDVLVEAMKNVRTSSSYIRRSFTTLYVMYVVLFAIGVTAAVVAVIKGFEAQSPGEAAGSLAIGGLSAASFFALFLSRPLESMERNTIYSAWLTAVTTTYWTQLMYLTDPDTVGADLSRITAELVTDLKNLTDRHSIAIGKAAKPPSA